MIPPEINGRHAAVRASLNSYRPLEIDPKHSESPRVSRPNPMRRRDNPGCDRAGALRAPRTPWPSAEGEGIVTTRPRATILYPPPVMTPRRHIRGVVEVPDARGAKRIAQCAFPFVRREISPAALTVYRHGFVSLANSGAGAGCYSVIVSHLWPVASFLSKSSSALSISPPIFSAKAPSRLLYSSSFWRSSPIRS